MISGIRRTKIVATLGPASSSRETIERMMRAGMDVARLNFSHGTHEDHARTLTTLREVAAALDRPVTVLQDLQGPKVRIGELPGSEMQLEPDSHVWLVPADTRSAGPPCPTPPSGPPYPTPPATEGRRCETGAPPPSAALLHGPLSIPIDYPNLHEEAKPGTPILLADGAMELEVTRVTGHRVECRVVRGGILKSRKGVNLPTLHLSLPSLTDKDKHDLEFGLAHEVDAVSLSFVRTAKDISALRTMLDRYGALPTVVAKIERPQAVIHLDEIVEASDAVMVARGDLGVEMSPDQVPMIQKRIIEQCNRRGRPVITATQMLESMIHAPLPTRAEASDVANAIIDGTDAVMLSGETAIGAYPVEAVEMMARIAGQVEAQISFRKYPPPEQTRMDALCEGIGPIEAALAPACIAVLTTSGHTAARIAAERPRAPVIAITADPRVYHRLNLVWGLRPLLVPTPAHTFEELVALADQTVRSRQLAHPGQTILVVGGIPAGQVRGSNFIKVHVLQ